LDARQGILEVALPQYEMRTTPLSPALIPAAHNWNAGRKSFLQKISLAEEKDRNFQEIDDALRVSEERYSELFENANDAIFTVDASGTFTSANRACEQLTGYRRSETSSMHFAQIVAPEYLGQVGRSLERKLAGGGGTTYEIEVIAKDGHRVPLELSSRPIYRNGALVGVQGIARDITDRRRAREALRRLNETREEEARRIAHALHDESSQLLAVVHDAVAELAAELPPQAQKQLRQISQLLNQVEDQLRRLSHELRPTILDDLGLLPAVHLLVEGISKRTGLPIAVRGSTDGRLPRAIETAIYRSIQEALTNVTKHAHATVARVELRREPKAIHCSIWDDGGGMDVPPEGQRGGERGLGLIGIRERLDPFRGILEIHSSPRRGTELITTIPLDPDNWQAISAEADRREPPHVAADHHR
jgi:PAS domain S-box-containing protein